MRGERIKLALKAGYHRPASETPLVSQGIRTSIAKKRCIFVILGGGLDPYPPSLWIRACNSSQLEHSCDSGLTSVADVII